MLRSRVPIITALQLFPPGAGFCVLKEPTTSQCCRQGEVRRAKEQGRWAGEATCHGLARAAGRPSRRPSALPVQAASPAQGKGAAEGRVCCRWRGAASSAHATDAATERKSVRAAPAPTPVLSPSPPTEMSTGGRISAHAARACGAGRRGPARAGFVLQAGRACKGRWQARRPAGQEHSARMRVHTPGAACGAPAGGGSTHLVHGVALEGLDDLRVRLLAAVHRHVCLLVEDVVKPAGGRGG